MRRDRSDRHRPSPFDFTDEWEATELLLKAKAAQDARLAPDGYTLIWNCSPDVGHAHLHVIPRSDDEPLADRGGRSAILFGSSPGWTRTNNPPE